VEQYYTRLKVQELVLKKRRDSEICKRLRGEKVSPIWSLKEPGGGIVWGWSNEKAESIKWAAFYSDCEHEVREATFERLKRYLLKRPGASFERKRKYIPTLPARRTMDFRLLQSGKSTNSMSPQIAQTSARHRRGRLPMVSAWRIT
jgi:hypothetical protein